MPRLEHKYLVPETLLAPLRRALAPFVRADDHASPHDDGAWMGYTVRSIYFDTSRLTHYYQIEEGVQRRAKLRIRGYDQYRAGDDVILEIKRKNGPLSSKQRAAVPYPLLEPLLASGDVGRLVHPTPDAPDSVANAGHFVFRLRRDALHPVLQVVYDREPHVGLTEPSLRITLDRNIRSMPFPSLAQLFEERAARPSWPQHFVLEVKYDLPYGFPAWLRAFITEHDLTRASLSKYRSGVADQGMTRAPSRARVLGSASWALVQPFSWEGASDAARLASA